MFNPGILRALTVFRNNAYHLVLLSALVASLLFKGLGLTPDSNAYIQGAIQLAHSTEYKYFQGARISLFPPGTSIAYLSFYQLINDITLSVYMVNIAALILTYVLMLRLFQHNWMKSTLAIIVIFPFFCVVNSESIWIPLLILWLIKIRSNSTFYNPFVSASLIAVRYASIVPLNCYYLTMILFEPKNRMQYFRNLALDSLLFLIIRRLIGGTGGHSIGLGVAKYNFFENILTAYSSLFGLLFSHFFWQLTKPYFIPILFILSLAAFMICYSWKRIVKPNRSTITFINFCIAAQALLLSLTYVWDSNGLRYNFWVILPALTIVRIEKSNRNLAFVTLIVLSAVTFSIRPWERGGRWKITDCMEHPYLIDGKDSDFQMKTYKWEEEDAR